MTGRSGVEVGMDQVPHVRFLLDVLANAGFDVTIAARESFVLPNVFGPRAHQKCLDVHVGIFEVAKNPPPYRPVAMS